MKKPSIIYFFILALLLVACKFSDSKELNEQVESIEVPVENHEHFDENNQKTEDPAIEDNLLPDAAKNKKKKEEKYGEQWDFCHCIQVNDSLDKVVKKGGEIGDDFMRRFDEVDKHCKAFLGMNKNRTPEERDAHEKNVKNCLKNSK